VSPRREGGFSLIEMLVAAAILAIGFVVLFQFVASGQRVARAQPDAADMRQRLRVAADMIQRDLLMAGAGLVHGEDAGPLVNYLPPILPRRTGAKKADPELSFFDDRISILYVEAAAASAPLASNMAATTADVLIIASASGCPSAGLCGFEDGSRSVIADLTGPGLGFDLFSVAGTSAGLAHGPPDPDFSRAYPAKGSRVMPVKQRIYYLDAAASRLMVYDGYETDVPLADNIVLLRFEYFLDPWASSVRRPPDGESNCVYAAGIPPSPVLADFAGPTLVPAAASLLTDGPVCGLPPNQFDGDLLRIRRIRVTIRAQAADRSLRGSGPDYVTPGVSTSAANAVPDLEVTFDVSPRNLQATK
jgi:prepilin-type N-terminal cleavage/methylation domain-containing protein